MAGSRVQVCAGRWWGRRKAGAEAGVAGYGGECRQLLHLPQCPFCARLLLLCGGECRQLLHLSQCGRQGTAAPSTLTHPRPGARSTPSQPPTGRPWRSRQRAARNPPPAPRPTHPCGAPGMPSTRPPCAAGPAARPRPPASVAPRPPRRTCGGGEGRLMVCNDGFMMVSMMVLCSFLSHEGRRGVMECACGGRGGVRRSS